MNNTLNTIFHLFSDNTLSVKGATHGHTTEEVHDREHTKAPEQASHSEVIGHLFSHKKKFHGDIKLKTRYPILFLFFIY